MPAALQERMALEAEQRGRVRTEIPATVMTGTYEASVALKEVSGEALHIGIQEGAMSMCD